MHDLTTMLQNFALTATNRAENLRKEAAEIRARPGANGFPEYNRVRDAEAAQKDAEAARWTARASKAREGYLLVDASDVSFQMDDHFRELIDHAASEHRIVYIEPVMDVNPLN
jgi:hypothetical protein